MSSSRLQKYINLNFLNYILIAFFLIYSIYIVSYHYDGHHIGLVYSNALDLIKGKHPYKEIFIQYGFLTTLIHASILILFDYKVIFLSIFTIIFYSFSILLISLSLKNLLNHYYALFASVIILFNHPIPWLPWSNYIAFFFLSLGVFICTKKYKNYYFIGLFFGLTVLSRQEFFIPIILSALFFFAINILKNKKFTIKNNLNLILGFFTPLVIFLIYLFYNNIFFNWKNFLIIPNFYLQIYQTSLNELVTNFIFYFLTESFFNFIITPQYFIISAILISNSILIFLKILNKIDIPNNIFYFSLLSIFLCSLSLQIEIFRLYTSIIIGLIPMFYFLDNIKDKIFKDNLLKLLLLPSIFAIFFYPFGNNPVFKKINFEQNTLQISNKKFQYLNWPYLKIKSINLITQISKKCDVDYLDNLTFDSIYSTVADYDRIRMLPYEKNSLKESEFHFYIDSLKNSKINFIEKINFEIKKENIILLINENNHIYKDKKIIVSERYNVIKINESDVIGRPNVLNIYLPKKCLI